MTDMHTVTVNGRFKNNTTKPAVCLTWTQTGTRGIGIHPVIGQFKAITYSNGLYIAVDV